MEIPISGDYKPGEIDSEGVMSGHMVVLQAILDMLANNSNANYKDVCEALGVPVK